MLPALSFINQPTHALPFSLSNTHTHAPRHQPAPAPSQLRSLPASRPHRSGLAAAGTRKCFSGRAPLSSSSFSLSPHLSGGMERLSERPLALPLTTGQAAASDWGKQAAFLCTKVTFLVAFRKPYVSYINMTSLHGADSL